MTNRRMRARMSGGVGGGGATPPPTRSRRSRSGPSRAEEDGRPQRAVQGPDDLSPAAACPGRRGRAGRASPRQSPAQDPRRNRSAARLPRAGSWLPLLIVAPACRAARGPPIKRTAARSARRPGRAGPGHANSAMNWGLRSRRVQPMFTAGTEPARTGYLNSVGKCGPGSRRAWAHLERRFQ